MNGLARAFITTFFSWLRSLFNALWNSFSGNRGFFSRLFENWLLIIILLLLIGTVLDGIYKWKMRKK